MPHLPNHPPAKGNLFEHLAGSRRPLEKEQLDTLCRSEGVRLERIVSWGHATPQGEWYDQEWSEWVVLLKGHAKLRFEDDPESLELHPGDYLLIPAHHRHRVEWTDPGEPSVWLALHIKEHPAP